MSIQGLEAAFAVDASSPLKRIILCLLEAAGKGMVSIGDYDDFRDLACCSRRGLVSSLKELQNDGWVTVTEVGRRHHVIAFSGHSIKLQRPASGAFDDPWAVLRARVFSVKGSDCNYCGAPASHVDHVVPRSKGGADHIDNLVPACARCNVEKGSKLVTEWRS